MAFIPFLSNIARSAYALIAALIAANRLRSTIKILRVVISLSTIVRGS
jgi:hypothetical protein